MLKVLLNPNHLEKVHKFSYIADRLTADGGCDLALIVKVQVAQQVERWTCSQ